MLGKRIARVMRGSENVLAYASLFLLALFPTLAVIARKFFHTGVPNSTEYTRYLVLILAFVAGAVTARENKHLSLTLNLHMGPGLNAVRQTVINSIAAAFCVAFAWASLSFALNWFDASQKVGGVPLRLISLIMVAGYALMAVRFIFVLPRSGWYRWVAGIAALLGTCLALGAVASAWDTLFPRSTGLFASLLPFYQQTSAWLALPLVILLLLLAPLGLPIFVILGGIAYMLFARTGQPLEVIPNQAFTILTEHAWPAIPLFTFTGFILSESNAGERLIRFFRAIFSWFPGGLAVTAILVCAFFTTFTGASGVTILALGGLLLIILTKGNYAQTFSSGLLTASGSIGLLFPPSLPIIIYGVTAQVSIKDMFIGGILPGTVLVLAMAFMAVIYASRTRVERLPLNISKSLAALRESIWEILLPFIIFIGYFGVSDTLVKRLALALAALLTFNLVNQMRIKAHLPASISRRYFFPGAYFLASILFANSFTWLDVGIVALSGPLLTALVDQEAAAKMATRERLRIALASLPLIGGILAVLVAISNLRLTLVESAACAALYALLVETLIHRDLKPRDIPRIAQKCLPIIGGVMMILALAYGFQYYLVDAEVPMKLASWVQAHIHSKYIFLLLLNLALLVVGCLMDIFSAILVVVPLIIPLGQLFGIHPVHLGIIFLANLELGYLTPPVGLNLYLASYRFNQPIIKIYREVLPFLLIQLAAVLLITYVPFLSTALLAFGK